MKQNQRKNKTNLAVAWPTTTYFTIQSLHKINPKFVEITLRVRLTNEITAGVIAEIGSVPGGGKDGKGRPPKVFAFTPITQNVLNKARQDGINLADGVDKLVNVISVTTPTASTTSSPSVSQSSSTVAVR